MWTFVQHVMQFGGQGSMVSTMCWIHLRQERVFDVRPSLRYLLEEVSFHAQKWHARMPLVLRGVWRSAQKSQFGTILFG
jgi:hypothetical protein